jgi:nitrous oxidase accessory protein
VGLAAVLVMPEVGAEEPPRDLAALIADTADGATLHLRPGRYQGGVVVDRPMTIEASGDAVIDGGGVGIVVKVTSPDVTLRGLVLRGSGDVLEHEDAAVRAEAPRFRIEDSRIEESLFGIYLLGAPDSLVARNDVTSIDLDLPLRADGIHIYQSSRTVVEDNTTRDGRDVIVFFRGRRGAAQPDGARPLRHAPHVRPPHARRGQPHLRTRRAST